MQPKGKIISFLFLGAVGCLLVIAMAANRTASGAPSQAQNAPVYVYADADATVDSFYPTSNFGGDDYLEVYYDDYYGPEAAFTLLHFDVASALPANAEIDVAVLELYMVGATGLDTINLGAYYVNEAWNEYAVT